MKTSYCRSLLVAGLVAGLLALQGCAAPPEHGQDESRSMAASSALSVRGITSLETSVTKDARRVRLFDARGTLVSEITFSVPVASSTHVRAAWNGASYEIETTEAELTLRRGGRAAVATVDTKQDALRWTGASDLPTEALPLLGLIGIVGRDLGVDGPWAAAPTVAASGVEPLNEGRVDCVAVARTCNRTCYSRFSRLWNLITGNLNDCLQACFLAGLECIRQTHQDRSVQEEQERQLSEVSEEEARAAEQAPDSADANKTP